MHSVLTVYTLFITVKIVSQSQQIQPKKKKKHELINVDAEPKRLLYVTRLQNFRGKKRQPNDK